MLASPITSGKAPDLGVILREGSRAVFEQAGYLTSEPGNDQYPLSLIVHLPTHPDARNGIVCLDAVAAPEPWEITDLIHQLAAHHFAALHFICGAEFSEATIHAGAQHPGIFLTGGAVFRSGFQQLPREIRERIEATAAEVANRPPPPPPAPPKPVDPPSLDEVEELLGEKVPRSAPGKGFLGNSPIVKAAVLVLSAFGILMAYSQIKQGATQLAQAFAPSPAQPTTTTITVAGQGSEAESGRNDDSILVVTSSPGRPAKLSKAQPELRRIDVGNVDALTSLTIADDAPTLTNRDRSAERKFYTQLWGLDELQNPHYRQLAEALLDHHLRDVGGIPDIENAETIMLQALEDIRHHPRFGCALATRFVPPAQLATHAAQLHPLLDHIGAPILKFQLDCNLAIDSRQRGDIMIAMTSLREMLDETEGFYQIGSDIGADLLFEGNAGLLFDLASTRMSDIISGHRDVEPWLRDLAAGRHYIKAAWAARGGASHSQLSDEQKERFESHLADAHDALRRSWEAKPEHPAAAAAMITIAMGQGKPLPDRRQWFDRAITARADYMPAYENMLNGLMQRWGGSDQHLAAFGKACVFTGRFDTRIPSILLASHKYRARDWKDERSYWKVVAALPGTIDELDRLFTGWENHDDGESQQRTQLSTAAVIWHATGRPEKMFTALEKIDFNISPAAFAAAPYAEQDIIAAVADYESRKDSASTAANSTAE